MTQPQSDVTRLLLEWRRGKASALDELMPLVYEELRRLASSYMRRERSGHTLQPTALIHEAYLRMVDKDHPRWKSRLHFFAVAAQVMRRILIDYARGRSREKRHAEAELPLEEVDLLSEERAAELVKLDDALSSLESLDPKLKTLVELRYFGGLTNEEAAEYLEVSSSTVKRDWRLARSFLQAELQPGELDAT